MPDRGITAALLLALALPIAAVPTNLLVYKGAIPLPGVRVLDDHEPKMDHLDADVGRGLLYVSVKENDTVAIVDMRARAFVGSIAGVADPQGLVYEPSLDLVVVACGGDGAVRAFGGAAPHAPAWATALPEDADNIVFDRDARGFWVAAAGDEAPGGLTLLDARDGAAVQTVAYPAGAHPECFSLAARGPLLYGSAPTSQAGDDVSLIVVVNRTAPAAVAATWALAPLGLNQPFATIFDNATGHLFVATRSNDTGKPAFAVLDTARAGALLFAAPTNAVCDDLAWDARKGLIFISCGGKDGGGDADSSLSIVRQVRRAGGAVDYTLEGDVATYPPSVRLARTMYWDRDSETLFVAVPAGIDFLNRTQDARLLTFGRGPGAAT